MDITIGVAGWLSTTTITAARGMDLVFGLGRMIIFGAHTYPKLYLLSFVSYLARRNLVHGEGWESLLHTLLELESRR
jgi:hypothetical protein